MSMMNGTSSNVQQAASDSGAAIGDADVAGEANAAISLPWGSLIHYCKHCQIGICMLSWLLYDMTSIYSFKLIKLQALHATSMQQVDGNAGIWMSEFRRRLICIAGF